MGFPLGEPQSHTRSRLKCKLAEPVEQEDRTVPVLLKWRQVSWPHQL